MSFAKLATMATHCELCMVSNITAAYGEESSARITAGISPHSPALVIGIPGTAVIPAWDAICPRLCH